MFNTCAHLVNIALFNVISMSSIYTHIEQIIRHLKSKQEAEARRLFNEHIAPHLAGISNKDHPLFPMTFFIYELDDYLNNEGLKILGVADLSKVLDSYYDEAWPIIEKERKK